MGNKVRTKLRHREAFTKMVENGGNEGKALREVGYSKAVVNNPKKVIETKSFQTLLDTVLNDEKLAKIHDKLLNKVEKDGQPHTDSKYALDMAYKLKGTYKAEKKDITSGGLSLKELFNKGKELSEGDLTD